MPIDYSINERTWTLSGGNVSYVLFHDYKIVC